MPTTITVCDTCKRENWDPATDPKTDGEKLAELQVPEADLRQKLERTADRPHRGEELRGLVDRHLEDVGDRLLLEEDGRFGGRRRHGPPPLLPDGL